MKLGEHTIDTATGVKVTPVSLYVLTPDGSNRRICCQPRGVNPKTGQPLTLVWLTDDRLKDGPVEGVVPHHLIGEEVEDDSTGLRGKITEVVLFVNGCVHAEVSPRGVNKDGEMIPSVQFDIRRLRGKGIKKWTEAALAESRAEHPSPMECGRPRH